MHVSANKPCKCQPTETYSTRGAVLAKITKKPSFYAPLDDERALHLIQIYYDMDHKTADLLALGQNHCITFNIHSSIKYSNNYMANS